jgi:YebC/PmpR family DNA-binding regulatory protein
MAGHSKWANTKRRKAKVDAARAKIFNRVIREITVAAKMGGSDQESNPRLRTAVLKAKAANMPNKNIDTAIAKGANELQGVTYHEPTYEGYGPGGISIMVDCLTDNKTRTVANIRHAFSKHGGNMGETGSVAWMFKTVGIITVDKELIGEDALMELVLEAGAEDFSAEGEEYEIITEQGTFQTVLEALQAKDIESTSAEVTKIADTKTKVEGDVAEKALKLLDALDDDDDVQNVSTNAEIDE